MTTATRPPRRLYIDTSAYLCILPGRRGMRPPRMDEDLERFVLRDLTRDLCESNALPPVATPRSLDLAHLRTALWFHAADGLARFVTTDTSQQQAAHDLGLPI